MEEKNIGISLTKILSDGELLAQNIDRGVQVVKERNTLEAVNKVVKKVNEFYNNIKDIKFNGQNLNKVLYILKAIKPALEDLKTIKDSLVNVNVDVKTNPSL